LVLTGGGARSAYQAGVLKGVAELMRRGSACPFPVITGTSAGAVSAVALASDAAHFRRSVYAIERVWRDFRVHHVFKTDPASLVKSALHWLLAVATGGWLVHPPHALFDNAPLWDLLRRQLDFDGIPRSLYKQHLHALGICATCYNDAASVTFYASAPTVDAWSRVSRKGARAVLTLEHLMASLAIPFLFRPVLLNSVFFGDGAMRQTSPLSPAIHLGANRLFIIGVNDPLPGDATRNSPLREPTFGQMFGFMLDSLFMDQLTADLERINRYNHAEGMRRIDALLMTPSRDVNEIAQRHARELPGSLRAMMRIFGASSTAGSGLLLSYLLFERGFTREMIQLGYDDSMARAAEIRDFLKLTHVRQSRAPRERERTQQGRTPRERTPRERARSLPGSSASPGSRDG
jgi:NTE family protein